MGEVLLKFDCKLTYEPGKGVEVHLKHGGSISHEVTQHLTRAARELSLALQLFDKPELPEKVRTKIEVEEA